MRLKEVGTIFILSLCYGVLATAFPIIYETPLLLLCIVPLFFVLNIFPERLLYKEIPTARLKVEYHGVISLLVFLGATVVAAVLLTIMYFAKYFGEPLFTTDGIHREMGIFILTAIFAAVVLFALFLNGYLSVFFTSVELGVAYRVFGFLFGLLFPVNLILLLFFIGRCHNEVITESGKIRVNRARAHRQICKTKYPILLVHGVFFRDSKILNYWGRIPGELEKNGATVYYGEHQSALSIAESAKELEKRIRRLIEDKGCEKVNIIAHSKGGLDCRYILNNGGESMIASLITINTPHRGCEFADYLFEKVPENVQKKIEEGYNTTARRIGDEAPDFMAAVRDLRSSFCEAFDREMKTPEGVFTRSVGSCLKKAVNGRFPTNVFYNFVKHFDGDNDGLVGEHSFKWGDRYTYLVPEKNRGISHGDMVDIHRESIPGFDVREFYVQMVSDLRERGL